MITNLYIDLNGTSLHDIEKLGLNYLILARTNENNSWIVYIFLTNPF